MLTEIKTYQITCDQCHAFERYECRRGGALHAGWECVERDVLGKTEFLHLCPKCWRDEVDL